MFLKDINYDNLMLVLSEEQRQLLRKPLRCTPYGEYLNRLIDRMAVEQCEDVRYIEKNSKTDRSFTTVDRLALAPGQCRFSINAAATEWGLGSDRKPVRAWLKAMENAGLLKAHDGVVDILCVASWYLNRRRIANPLFRWPKAAIRQPEAASQPSRTSDYAATPLEPREGLYRG